MFNMAYGEEMRHGVERCCQRSGDSCFLVGNAGDRFTLVHFTGESDYIVDQKWMDASKMHMTSSGVQNSLVSSSCDVIVEMARVSNYVGVVSH